MSRVQLTRRVVVTAEPSPLGRWDPFLSDDMVRQI